MYRSIYYQVCFTHLCVVAAILTSVIGFTGTGLNENSQNVLVARCRASCLKQFWQKPHGYDNSERCQDGDCDQCWQVCSLLFRSYLVWGEMCSNKLICRKGCQAACHFKRNPQPARAVPGKWEISWFAGNDDQQYTWMEWSDPRQTSPSVPSVPSVRSDFVYIIFVKDGSHPAQGDWKQLQQTPNTFAEFKTGSLFAKAEFWLVGIAEDGIVAERTLTIETVYDGDTVDSGSNGVGQMSHKLVKPEYLNMTVTVSSVKGKVNATIVWQNPHVPENKTILYTLSWFRTDCNAYREGQDCELTEESFFKTVTANGQQPQITTRLNDVTYNSKFSVILDAKDGDLHMTGKRDFYTPLCYSATKLFKKCLQENRTNDFGDPNTTVSPVDLMWQLNVSETVLSQSGNGVTVNLTWAPLFNHSGVQYNVSWERHSSPLQGLGTATANGTFISLSLDRNTRYRVMIVATFGSTDGRWTILGERSVDIYTHVEPQVEPSVSLNKSVQPTSRALDGVIIGVTCITTAVTVFIIIFVLYKKRQTVKDVIITKTAVTKSNSYKSSVGYKADYANELLVVTDEWELDPEQLKFSDTPLGQGAFGKVVTGYCGERKVAIKVLKDCAPLSYKEDLLAEINLMKKLGTHPNIVSLVGACTLHEPIALVMEYVPYGNLQSFLRKCRQEGELRKNGRRRELTYSMVDAHGSIENGVINAADILSFARQIVMAMEYLAEKKYVHRDLAARNVLLDHNKVVKVCDFGLSRDIYNDNQYKKLTSGKLPIKWMAIESLRDRVFTTQSDVWSFGILLWESVTMGASPYPNIALADLFYMLSNGYRMEKPSNCSDELYNIMRMTWKESPKERPNFTQLRLHMEDLLTRDCNYLELENIDVPLNNAESSSLPLSDPFSTSSMASAAQAEARQDRLSSDEMTVDVCVHDKSTDKLLNQADDCERVMDYRNFRQKRKEMR